VAKVKKTLNKKTVIIRLTSCLMPNAVGAVYLEL